MSIDCGVRWQTGLSQGSCELNDDIANDISTAVPNSAVEKAEASARERQTGG